MQRTIYYILIIYCVLYTVYCIISYHILRPERAAASAGREKKEGAPKLGRESPLGWLGGWGGRGGGDVISSGSSSSGSN